MAINTTLDWTSAKEACGNLAEGATLISIDDAFENHAAQGFFQLKNFNIAILEMTYILLYRAVF
jgi:hypothetical protein